MGLFLVEIACHPGLPLGGPCRQYRSPFLALGLIQRGGVDGGVLGGTEIEGSPVRAGGGEGQLRPVLGLAVAEGFLFTGGQMEVTYPQLNLDPAGFIGGKGGNGAEARLVEDFQRNGLPRPGLEGVGLGVGVAGCLVVVQGLSLPVQRGAMEGQVGHRAEGAAVDQHGPGGGGVEPAPVQHRLRLAGPQEAPLALTQHLHPGVVVVAVGPAGGVHLPGGQTHSAQGGHQEGGLLPAPAAAAAVYRQGGGGAVVLGLIAGLLMAPAVDLQGGLLLGQVLHPVPQMAVKQCPVVGQILVVDPGAEDVLLVGLPAERSAPGDGLAQHMAVGGEGLKQGLGVAVPVLRQGLPDKSQFLIHMIHSFGMGL